MTDWTPVKKLGLMLLWIATSGLLAIPEAENPCYSYIKHKKYLMRIADRAQLLSFSLIL